MAENQTAATVVSIQARHAAIPFAAVAEVYRTLAQVRVEADNARRDAAAAVRRLDDALRRVAEVEEILGECLSDAWGNG